MGRKVFLSFLGTNDYLYCNYYEENNNDKKIENVRFIQEALVKLYCNDFTKDDKIFIFLTSDARKNNWEDGDVGYKENKRFEHGLKYKLNNIEIKSNKLLEKNRKLTIEDYSIPEGYSQEEIWEIFNIVFSKLEKDDEIIFDITHGFRSLPMLGVILLNYSKFLKNIKIKGVYYGAFEKLGPAHKVRKLDIEKRDAPILDLISFNELQDWSVGVDNFINYGNSNKISKLIENDIVPRLSKSKGKDKEAKILSNFNKKLSNVMGLFSTIRGKEIINGDKFKLLQNSLKEIKENEIEFKALNPIIEKIEDLIKNYKENYIQNCYLTLQQYINNNQIQQAITLLQELIITIILSKNNLPYDELEPRSITSDTIRAKSLSIKKENWSPKLKSNIYIAEKLLSCSLLSQLTKSYEALRDYRNSINHGGLISEKYIKAESFSKKLNEVFKELEKVISQNNLLP